MILRSQVLLIYPPTGSYVREDRCQVSIDDQNAVPFRPPMDLAYIAGSLQANGATCRIVDCPAEGVSWDDLRQIIGDFATDMLIISVTTPTVPHDMVAATLAKEVDPGILTVAKGAHFLVHDEEVLQACADLDAVIRGETEETAVELGTVEDLAQIKGISFRRGDQVFKNEERPFIKDLDSIAFPARNLLDNSRYIRPDTGAPQATIKTSRGCPHSCIYCLAPLVSGKAVRTRSPQNIVDEIEECVTRYGVTDFHFRSDLFTAKKSWVVAVCQEILDRKLKITWACNSRVDTIDEERLAWMKKAGCWMLSFGVEHGDQEILEQMQKRATVEQARQAVRLCKKQGIRTYLYFIIGFPDDTEETVEKTIAFALELDGDFVEFYHPYPFPGTEINQMFKASDLLEGDEFPLQSFAIPLAPTKTLSKERLVALRKEALRRFYMRPSYVLRTLGKARNMQEIKNYMRYGTKVVKKIFTEK